MFKPVLAVKVLPHTISHSDRERILILLSTNFEKLWLELHEFPHAQKPP